MRKAEKEYLQSYWAQIQQAGEVLRGQALPELTQEKFNLFHETGNRLVYEDAYFGRRKQLTVFGILAEYGQVQADVEKLAEIMEAVCGERFWALPAHVSFEHPDENTIDLFAAETAQTLAEMLVIFGERLPEKLIETVQTEVMRRVLTSFCSEKTKYGWETDRCNWSAVCAGSVGMAAIYMYRLGVLSEEWKEQCIERVCAAMEYYLSGLEEDGACTEGLGYYNYGMSYFTAFAELLYEENAGKTDLLAQLKCRKVAAFQGKCYFGHGVSVSFSDGSSEEHFYPGMSAYLAHRFPEAEVPDYRVAHFLEDDACYRWLMNERNIRWLMKYSEAEKSDEDRRTVQSISAANYLLPAAQWMICRDAQGNGFAAKGGHNAESHNHNDIGHFLCVYNGKLFLTDLGAGEYTKDYFGSGRYDILCNRSLGHSIPLINGCEQCAGKEYRADCFKWSEEEHELTISFAGAYPEGIIEELVRSVQWKKACTGEVKVEAEKAVFTLYQSEVQAKSETSQSKELPLQLKVTDRFTPSAGTESITENLITPYEPVVTEQGIELHAETEEGACTCRLTVMVRLAGGDWQQVRKIMVLPKEHSLHDGKKTTVYLLQWDVPVCEGKTAEGRVEINIAHLTCM